MRAKIIQNFTMFSISQTYIKFLNDFNSRQISLLALFNFIPFILPAPSQSFFFTSQNQPSVERRFDTRRHVHRYGKTS
jgi:hypothetical protein